jgi:hypothetical protein
MGGNSLVCNCTFSLAGENYRLRATWVLDKPLDMLLGLEFKSVILTVSKEDGPEIIFDGRLFQPTKQRLNSLYTTNVRRQDGSSGGPVLKYRMTSKLFHYAV